MIKSGFDVVVKELINKGIIYIGVSAGTYVACPTIEMATWKNPDIDSLGVKNFTALNLIPFLVSVHYTEELKSLIKT